MGAHCTASVLILSHAEIDRVNASHQEEALIIGSTDVKALYPSLDIDFTVEKVCLVVEKSNLTVDGVNYKELGLYIAVNTVHNPDELTSVGLNDFCPTRSTNRGRKPTMASLRGMQEDKRWSNWVPAKKEPGKTEKRKMLMYGLRIAMLFIMKNHIYSFSGEYWKQSRGGPIGLDLTGAIAQIFMIWWDTEFKERVRTQLHEVTMLKRYVDDINTALPPAPPGSRYVQGKVVVVPEEVEADLAISADKRTMTLLKAIGDSIHPSIQLEVDYPSKYVDAHMPILDLKVWVEVQGGRPVIKHEHYAKAVSSKAVVAAKSAFPWQNKRTVISQDALRILLNCSRDLSWEKKAAHLTVFSARMQFSGYSHAFRYHVIASAIKAYENLREKENNNVRPLYRERSWNRAERDQLKSEKRLNWYKKGGYDSVIFLPTTPRSSLVQQCKEAVEWGA